MDSKSSIIWFDQNRIPNGTWPFLGVVHKCLRSIAEDSLLQRIDITEGLEGITSTGRLELYRQLILRRTLDLSQSTICCWNSQLIVGSVISARALLETLASFHSLVFEIDAAVAKKDWESVSKITDAYLLSTSEGPRRNTGKTGGPPKIGFQVLRFISSTQPNQENFWHQISDFSHPNGRRMFNHYGAMEGSSFVVKPIDEREVLVFHAIYNCLYSVCWLYGVLQDFDELLDRIRYLPIDETDISKSE